MKHTVARHGALRRDGERYGAARSQLSFSMFAALAWLVGNHVVGCGDSESSTPSSSTSSNQPSGQSSGSSGATGSGNTPSATPAGESTPNNIALDPNRDQSQPINLVASGAVQCGGAGNYCVAPSGTCCITGGGMPGGGMMGGGMMGGGLDFSCAASAEACPADTTFRQECSSTASCGSGEVCCRSGAGGGMGGGQFGGGGNTSCESACAMGAVQVCLEDEECGAGNQCNGNGTCGPLPCTATSCADGQVCCRGQGGGAQNQCAAPDAAGACPNNQRKVCTTAADCPADFSCSPAGGFGGGGGVLVCTPPACTLTSCMAGQVCCLGGQIGGNPTCSAASDTGACPGNSRLLCETDADCAASPGTLCLPPPNAGMGALSCRVPPAPPEDAGVGDAG